LKKAIFATLLHGIGAIDHESVLLEKDYLFIPLYTLPIPFQITTYPLMFTLQQHQQQKATTIYYVTFFNFFEPRAANGSIVAAISKIKFVDFLDDLGVFSKILSFDFLRVYQWDDLKSKDI
jgi:hypothetical protein